MAGVFRPDLVSIRNAATSTSGPEFFDHARAVRLGHAGDAQENAARIADGRREAHPFDAQVRVSANRNWRAGRRDGDFAERFCFHRNQSQARILYLALLVTVTFTLVASCVPSVTVKTLALPLLSAQETSTPAGTARRPCATLCCAPLPVCKIGRA